MHPYFNAGQHWDIEVLNYTFDLNQWYQYAMVISNGTATIYVNGVAVHVEDGVGVVPDSLPTLDGLHLGTGEDAGYHPLAGVIDRATVSQSALSGAEILQRYVAGTPTPFDFSGFFRPVDNLPTVNVVKAGQGVPVKFSLSGDRGLNILATNSPSSSKIDCSSSDPLDVVEQTVTAGGSSLSYDPVSDAYTYVWKTDKAWAGTCRELTVKLSDGTEHKARFKLTK
jgi:hypothetical protein